LEEDAEETVDAAAEIVDADADAAGEGDAVIAKKTSGRP